MKLLTDRVKEAWNLGEIDLSQFTINNGQLTEATKGAVQNHVLVIPEGVTVIGNANIPECQVIVFPETLKRLDHQASFLANASLKKIVFQSPVVLGKYSFRGAKNKRIIIPGGFFEDDCMNDSEGPFEDDYMNDSEGPFDSYIPTVSKDLTFLECQNIELFVIWDESLKMEQYMREIKISTYNPQIEKCSYQLEEMVEKLIDTPSVYFYQKQQGHIVFPHETENFLISSFQPCQAKQKTR